MTNIINRTADGNNCSYERRKIRDKKRTSSCILLSDESNICFEPSTYPYSKDNKIFHFIPN